MLVLLSVPAREGAWLGDYSRLKGSRREILLMPGLCRVLAVAFMLVVCARSHAGPKLETFQSAGRSVHYEIFDDAATDVPLLILLHGVSEPGAEFYRSQASFFAQNGYEVLLLHYFDAARSHDATDQNYHAWAQALEDLVRECGVFPSLSGRPIFVVGYSLGASVALAAGSQALPVRAIAEWYGSLPDDFFYHFRSMPPLLILHGALDDNVPLSNAQQLVRLCERERLVCADHFYRDQGHGFGGTALGDAEKRTLDFFKER